MKILKWITYTVMCLCLGGLTTCFFLPNKPLEEIYTRAIVVCLSIRAIIEDVKN